MINFTFIILILTCSFTANAYTTSYNKNKFLEYRIEFKNSSLDIFDLKKSFGKIKCEQQYWIFNKKGNNWRFSFKSNFSVKNNQITFGDKKVFNQVGSEYQYKIDFLRVIDRSTFIIETNADDHDLLLQAAWETLCQNDESQCFRDYSAITNEFMVQNYIKCKIL